MKKILIIYTKMIVGGSTTSLLSLLNIIDYKKYCVDLLLLDNEGELQYLINKNVNVVAPILKEKHIFHIKDIVTFFKSRARSIKLKNRYIRAQYMSRVSVQKYYVNENIYDYGIAFLEFWPSNYLAYNVPFARKKIAWLHVNYEESRLDREAEIDLYSHFDKIVTVSESCKEAFTIIFPEYSNKVFVVENALDDQIVRERAREYTQILVDKEKINIVSCCRIVYQHKGLDRMLNALKEYKKISTDIPFMWYVIGNGLDYNKMKYFIGKNMMDSYVVMLGELKNPYPVISQMDLFVLPSRYEGKPMAVTEAQMLGVVPCVTHYSSATEQIKDGIDGIILDNNEDSLLPFLKALNENKVNLITMRDNLAKKQFSLRQAYDNFERLLDTDD